MGRGRWGDLGTAGRGAGGGTRVGWVGELDLLVCDVLCWRMQPMIDHHQVVRVGGRGRGEGGWQRRLRRVWQRRRHFHQRIIALGHILCCLADAF